MFYDFEYDSAKLTSVYLEGSLGILFFIDFKI